MAIKLPAFLTRTDAKSRILLVVATVVGVSLLIFFAARYFGDGPVVAPAKVANAPSGLQSVPGSQLSPEYYRALMQANAQSSQQAKITGGSAVATLVNVPGQQPSFGSDTSNCTILCPGTESADVTGDINDLLKQGKISQEDANRLLNMAKANVSIADYAAELDRLVKAGKITPEQARRLLEEYKKQHANSLVDSSAKTLDALIKAGQLPLEAGADLLALQKRQATSAEYAEALNRLARDGKITPQMAAQLLAQYTQQQAQEAAKEGVSQLQQMTAAGQITADAADSLIALQKSGASADEYSAELNKLVTAGKMTPATAAKLLQQYRAQRSALGPGASINSMLANANTAGEKNINDLVAQGKLAADVANQLIALRQNGIFPQDYNAALNQLVVAKKLSAQDAMRLMNDYQRSNNLNGLAQRLQKLQANNASVNDYAEELKRAVAAGLITPEEAARLLQEYQAMMTPIVPGAGVIPGTDANLPGGADFAKLQQRLAAQQTQPPGSTDASAPVDNSQQFAAAIAQAQAEEERARQQRIQQLMGAMSGQAQALIASWQPPVMQHRGGSAGSDAAKLGATTTTTTTTTTGTNGAAGGPTAASQGGPAIKAGTILFAILDTAVDSDYPDTPVMATIVEGKFKGAKLLGKLSIKSGKDRVSLTFNLMDMDAWPKTKSVNAFAIDPDTAHTVLASEVDYHYLSRYGAMMGSAFLTGYASAISSSGATTTNGVFGTSTVHPELSPGNKLAVGLGQVGTSLGNAVQSYVNTPPTVKIKAGVALGILFMGDVAA